MKYILAGDFTFHHITATFLVTDIIFLPLERWRGQPYRTVAVPIVAVSVFATLWVLYKLSRATRPY
jgi:multidrug efflux pump subunit AcrB